MYVFCVFIAIINTKIEKKYHLQSR